MPWFRVDDNLAMHQKTLRAGNAALGLWVRAGSWSMQNLTDGHIPADVVSLLGTRALAIKLVQAGLWIETIDGGYQFHEWSERQPSKAKIETERKAAAARKAAWRNSHKNGGVPA